MAHRVEKLLDEATAALIDGDTDKSMKNIQKAEEKLARLRDGAGPEIQDRLERLLAVARAAAMGIADARALISGAGTSARNVTTYDQRGEPRKVRTSRPTLGRF